MLGNRAIGREKALGVSWGLEALHAPFALPCWLMGILSAVVEIAMLVVFHPGKDLAFGGAITLQLISDEHPRNVHQALQKFPEELLGRNLMALALHKNVEHVPVLIDSSPRIVAFTVDR